MKKIFIILFFSFLSLFLLPQNSSFAFEQLVKVHVLSRYDLKQVQINSPLAQIKMIKRSVSSYSSSYRSSSHSSSNSFEERIGPPDMPLELKSISNKVELRIGSLKSEADEIWITPPRGSLMSVILGKDQQRKFGGKLMVRSLNGELFFVEELTLDHYVRGVLEAELPQGFPPEAQKAQAIVIRSYALANADRHLKEGYNFCDLTHCMVYAGRNLPYRSLDEVVEATQKLILTYQSKPIQALFHSTCGGHTSANQKVFGGKALPYLQGVDDGKYCERSPYAHWENYISLKILEEVLKKDPDTNPKGEIKNIRIASAEADKGRVFEVALEGKRNFTLPVLEMMSVVGKYLGWSQLKSNWFEVSIQEDTAHFVGKGLGHGVGFCQWGAKGMADEGKKFPEILQHYFPGTQLTQR